MRSFTKLSVDLLIACSEFSVTRTSPFHSHPTPCTACSSHLSLPEDYLAKSLTENSFIIGYTGGGVLDPAIN